VRSLRRAVSIPAMKRFANTVSVAQHAGVEKECRYAVAYRAPRHRIRAYRVGGTHHYWGTTGSLVVPVSLTWSDNRYELAAFRFADQQLAPFPGTHRERLMADPYWGLSLSRRWAIRARSGAGLPWLWIGREI
jgi:hypothetical protein